MEQQSLNTERALEMRAVVGEFERSGMTAREFARRVGIPVTTLTWWRHVWRNESDVSSQIHLSAMDDGGQFREVRVERDEMRPSLVEIALTSGDVVRVASGTDRETLLLVLEAVRASC